VFGTSKRRILDWENVQSQMTTRTNAVKRQGTYTDGGRLFQALPFSSYSFLPSFLIPFPLNSASLSPRIRRRDLGFTVALKIASTLLVYNLQTYTQVHIQLQKLYRRYKSVQRARRVCPSISQLCTSPAFRLPLGFGVLLTYMYPMTWTKGLFLSYIWR